MSTKFRSIFILFALLVFFTGSFTGNNAGADEIALKPDHPDRYVVVKGDTLWDIAARFLQSPWLWPEVWSYNPQIKNPHLIYPGDVVGLSYDEQGKPILTLIRGLATVKKSPKVRSSRVDKPIETVPLSKIQQFLGQPRVVSESDINNAAYIIASQDEHLIAGKNDTIYVRGLVAGGDKKFTVLRLGAPYRNLGAASNDILGYEAIHVADAEVQEFGDPATLKITHSNRESLIGDRLLPRREDDIDQTFIPHPPDTQIDAQIIAVVDGVSRVGQYQTIVVNVGEQDGLETGHVLAVFQSGGIIADTRAGSETVQLPDIKAGIVLVIRAYDRVSYALVMEAERDIRVGDHLRNPT